MSATKRPARSARAGRRPYHHGNLRRALLDEALATIRTAGVDALTLRAIGAAVGVSRMALYRHFADKRALLAAVATEGFRTLRARLVAAWEQGGRDDDAFHAMGLAYVRFAVANPSHYRVMFGGAVDPQAADAELATEAMGAFQALVDALAHLQKAKVMRADDDTTQMATHVWALVHGIAMLAIDGKLCPPGTSPDAATDALARYAFTRLRSGIAIATQKTKRPRTR